MDISWLRNSILIVVAIQLLYRGLQRFRTWYVIRRNLQIHWKGPSYHWFLGHLVHMRKDSGLMRYLLNQVPNFTCGHELHFGPFLSVLRVNCPYMARDIMSGTATEYPKWKQTYASLTPWLGLGLLTLDGSDWKRHRKLLTPGFRSVILKSYMGAMNTSVTKMIESLGQIIQTKGQSIEIMYPVSLMTMDSMMKCLMNNETGCQTIKNGKYFENNYIKSVYKASQLVVERLESKNILNNWDFFYNMTNNGKNFKKCCDAIHEYSGKVIQKRKRQIENEQKESIEEVEHRRNLDFLDILLEAKDWNGNLLSDEEIQAEVDTFMFEGHDTTASALSFTLYRLALHPEHQKLCYDEIIAVCGDDCDTPIKWPHLQELNYTTMCIKESMRLHATVPGVFRVATEDIVMCGKPVKKGTTFLVSCLGIHNNPKYWPDPEKFEPTRFSRENSIGRHNFAYIPFAAGARNCIGQNFALNELKISISQLVRKFQFSIDESRPMKPRSNMVYGTVDGLYLKVTPRE